MSSLKLKLAFLNSQPELEKKLIFFEPYTISSSEFQKNNHSIEILVVQANQAHLQQLSQTLRQKKLVRS